MNGPSDALMDTDKIGFSKVDLCVVLLNLVKQT